MVKQVRGFRSPVGRGERAKRGTEALADHQDQGATVKKKKEQRMSREVAALGTTVHQSRHDTGLSDVQLGHYARGPISGRSMADETARKRAKTAVAAWWSRWDEYRVWRAPQLMRDFGCYDFHAEVMESISRGLAESRRHAIRFLYEYIYGAPPEHDDEGISLWNGPEGTVTLIRHRLLIPEGSAELVRGGNAGGRVMPRQ